MSHPYAPTSDDRRTFLMGQCHVFALALSGHGLELLALTESGGEPPIAHVVARHPTEPQWFIDVDGPGTLTVLAGSYSDMNEPEIQEIDAAWIEEQIRAENLEPIDTQALVRAGVLASALMRDLGDPLLVPPVYRPWVVSHVGAPAGPMRRAHASHEGPGLSVSECPGAWRRIAGLGGMTYRMGPTGNVPGRFVDWHMLRSNVERAQLLEAADRAGLIERGTAWEIKSFDAEWDDWLVSYTDSESEAEFEAELGEESVVVSKVEVWRATEALTAYWAAQFDGALEAVHVEQVAVQAVLGAAHPTLDGMWWHDELDPARLSAPRGVIFPHRVGAWNAQARG